VWWTSKTLLKMTLVVRDTLVSRSRAIIHDLNYRGCRIALITKRRNAFVRAWLPSRVAAAWAVAHAAYGRENPVQKGQGAGSQQLMQCLKAG
jgi:hypothetical protein